MTSTGKRNQAKGTGYFCLVPFARIVLRHISGLATQALGNLDELLYTCTHKNPTEYR